MSKQVISGFLLSATLFINPTFAAAQTPTPTRTATPTPTAAPTSSATPTPTATPTATPMPSDPQARANTSQKGSLLKFPYIDVRNEDAGTTTIEISNDANADVNVNCVYVNERKDRTDFHFLITHKGTVTWDVLSGKGEGEAGPFNVALFPGGGSFGDPSILNVGKGELTCFAVDQAGSAQIAWNHLVGTATVSSFHDPDAGQPLQAFTYSAWAFTARGGVADGTPVGVPGNLQLTGGGAGTYDACPAYLIANFSPGGATLGTGRGDLNYLDNNLAVASCNEDLRQDFRLYLTKLDLFSWNAKQTKFTGSYICSDSVREFGLDPGDAPSDLVHPENFGFSVLGTADARLQVTGVASTQCPNSVATGLIGILKTSLAIGTGNTGESVELGGNLHGAGLQSGFVLWDPQSATVPQAKPRH
jgi:hypothetical protein